MIEFLKKRKWIGLIMALSLGLLSGCTRPAETAVPTAQEASTVPTEMVRQRRNGIQTLLVVCLDSFEIPEATDFYRNGNKADLIMVIILDEERGTTTALQLNPDTLVSFSAPGMTDSLETPLGLVYSYGSGGSDSCLYGSKAVSKLLGGVPIDHYMAFTADSIAIVNDMLGGVTVPVTEDIPGLVKEESVPISGETAVEFFRFRDAEDVDNEAHMERQRQYMTGMYAPFLEKTQQEDFLTKLTLQLGDALSTDLTLSQMMQMLQCLGTYTLEETVVTLPGQADNVDGDFRFQVDAKALEQTVESLFFGD